MRKFWIPADVPIPKHPVFHQNWQLLTRGTGKIFLLAGDQKIEHLNDDFFAPGVSSQDATPKHLFEIARKSAVTCLATHPGLLAQYGKDFSDVNYIVKLNAKTNLIPKENKDPESKQLWNFSEVLRLKQNGLKISGVGYTIYLGSEYEETMLEQAGKLISKAHKFGLLAIIWAYARGREVEKETSPHTIAGASGVASALGADFAKVHYPTSANPARDLQEAIKAGGRTGIITAGGNRQSAKDYLKDLAEQIHISKCAGAATGRNLHQRPLSEAISLANAGAKIIFENASYQQALKIFYQNNAS